MYFDGSHLTRLTNNQTIDDVPNWSSDGNYIVFSSFNNSEGNWDIYRIKNNGEGIENLGSEYASDWNPVMSHDDKFIAYIRYTSQNPDGEIVLMEIETRISKKVIDFKGTEHFLTWSSDGQWITFSALDSNSSGIFQVKMDGTELITLVDLSHIQKQPSWSPDGNYLAFVSDHDDKNNYQLYILSNANGVITQLTDLSCSVDSPSWSPK